MSDRCIFCGATYAVGTDPDDRPWRSLCACERETRCFKGAHYATHARLLDERTVFACDKHGLDVETRAETAVLPPEPVRERKASKPEAPKPKPKAQDPPPRRANLTPVDYAALYAGETWRVVCRCGSAHGFNERAWKTGAWVATNPTSMWGKGFHAIESHCPACDAPDRDPETGEETWRRETPQAPPSAPKTSPPKKKTRK